MVAGMTVEEKAAQKILVARGVKNLTYRHKHSPDFIFEGGGVEVKRVHKDGKIHFSQTQFKYLCEHPDFQVWIFKDAKLVKETPFRALDESMLPKKLAGFPLVIKPSGEKICATMSFNKEEIDWLDTLVYLGDFDSRSAIVRKLIRDAMKKKLEDPLK